MVMAALLNNSDHEGIQSRNSRQHRYDLAPIVIRACLTGTVHRGGRPLTDGVVPIDSETGWSRSPSPMRSNA